MLGKLRELADGLWLVPGAIVIAFAGLGLAVGELERTGGSTSSAFVYSGDAESATTILATVAGSLITVAGLTFSITLVALQLVSSQYSPLALRDFLADRVTQVTAGVFVGVFAFALLVLRTVRTEPVPSIPRVGVTLSIVLGIGALGLLLVFIHHTVSRMRVDRIAADIRRRSERLVAARPVCESPASAPADRESVPATATGFVARVDLDVLAKALPETVSSVWVTVRVGDFVVPGTTLLETAPRALDDDLRERLRAAVVVGDERDVRTDEGLGIRQLADIALRALSPGINDPTTACTCVGHLTALIGAAAARQDGCEISLLRDGAVRVSLPRVRFEELLEPLLEVGRACDDVRPRAAVTAALDAVATAAAAAAEGQRAERVRSEALRLRIDGTRD